MRIAFIGLPNSGKTTIFEALRPPDSSPTRQQQGAVRLHLATVKVPDEQVEALAALYDPKKSTHAAIEFVDVEGTLFGAGVKSRGDQLMSAYQGIDALVHVVRAFESELAPHPAGSVDPGRDYADLTTELVLSDLQVVERRLERLQARRAKGDKAVEAEEIEILEHCAVLLGDGLPLRRHRFTEAQQARLRGFGLLSAKPQVVVLNISEALQQEDRGRAVTATLQPVLAPPDHLCVLCGKLELELQQLEPDDAALFMEELGITRTARAALLQASLEALGLITFYTVGEDEVKAWLLPAGAAATKAAGTIHSDLERGFIRAEVVPCPELLRLGSLAEARKHALLRMEGKEYVVADGDVITIRFNV
ncbi:MAG: redox-regulated ATPase YchF [Candidatus Tectomicrobia bacterium]|nr:redox-regulated ATPase YchF [Candidatus Tectomicrobia bacterium]